MSFEVDVVRRIGARTVALAFRSGPGITALCGVSGVGKTSVLNMIAGLLKPDWGRICVAGATLFDSGASIDLPPPRRNAGYVFQDVRLFPHMRVRANLSFGQRREASAASALLETARFLGIDHLLDRWPATLSGGEAQRVAIGRALLRKPDFLLMDEPLSAVDAERREGILCLMEQMRDQLSLPILYVTHDRDEAARLASVIVDM